MSEISDIKTQLLNDLWLPSAKKGGEVLYPRLKKNKKMKLLSLTDDRNFQEIGIFEEEALITRDRVIAWTNSHLRKLRLETELSPAKVFGTTRYEDSVSGSSFALSEYFPFDIINLDFSSQNPDLESGRIEKEILSLERTVKLQRDNNCAGFVLVYTTLLDSHSLNYQNIVTASNALHIPQWSGLDLEDFSSSVTGREEKISCLESVINGICSKYSMYPHDEGFSTNNHCIGSTQKCICSIVGFMIVR